MPLAETSLQRQLWESFQPINRPSASDTYKRTMSGSSRLFADSFAAYTLAARKGLPEKGSDGRLIMAGLEQMLYPWFMNPVTREEVEIAEEHFTKHAGVKKFPSAAWQSVLANDGYFPIDIYGLPGGQTFLVKDGKHVPIMSVEGPGALVTHLEPHFENIYAPIIQATKARLIHEELGSSVLTDFSSQFAEFGLRSDRLINLHTPLLMAVYVGGGFTQTSDDQATLLFPKYFKDIGTIGHEYIMAFQKEGRTLEEAQELAYDEFVAENERSALLPDVIDTIHSGLPAILRQIQKNKGNGKVIMPRFDSGDIVYQCIYWKNMTLEAGITETKMVVEDGFNPAKIHEVKQAYAAAGFNPDDITVGVGGYFQEGSLRDTLSLVDKRGATMHGSRLERSLKFSDSPGKESIPGQLRIYERGDTLVVAQFDESIDGIILSQQLVANGRIVYAESLDRQHQRATDTWNKYRKIDYSPMTQAIIDARMQEKGAIQEAVRMRQ